MSTKDKLLSKRLSAIYDLILPGESVADIGTDHGYLPIALALSNKASRVYAIDNKEGPLAQAKAMVERYQVQSTVICSLVKDEHPYHDVDVWVIAGMGFETIKSILIDYEATIQLLKRVIVQVNHQLPEFRAFCLGHHYRILDEVIVKEGHFYPIVVIAYDRQAFLYNEKDLLLGPILRNKPSPTQQAYYAQKKEQLLQVLSQIPSDVPKNALIKRMVGYYEEALEQ